MSLSLAIAVGVGAAIAVAYGLIALAFDAFGRPLGKR
jgi:hypothetical protein